MKCSCLGPIALLLMASVASADIAIDFSQDIRPILSDRCYACHGPNDSQREGGFRLDVKESVLAEADSGELPIVPGDAEASSVYQRITSDDEFMVMPPEDSNKSLTKEEIELIRRWIDDGAAWSEHWAFVVPRRPELPDVSDAAWCRRPIDRFILARLDKEGLKPNGEADQATLIRRVTFDLTGLPPTLEEIDAFLADDLPDAYERVVDRLLESPHYGEHMARFWLDAARYGDTHGLHLDNYREMWPYRDWVVRAFNDNLPYDQFVIQQLAGDLLPDPSLDQRMATGFNRCHVTTNEGGSITEEVYVRNVVDRVVTTGAVFMGVTLDCTRCHDHKYDPFTMKDFYSLFAFFNSLDGDPMDGNKEEHPPVVKVPTEEQEAQQQELTQLVAAARKEITDAIAKVEYDEAADAGRSEQPQREEYVWIEDGVPAGANVSSEGSPDGKWNFATAPLPVFSGERSSMGTAEGRSQHFFEGAPKGPRIGKDDKLFAYVYLDGQDPPNQIMMQWNTGSWSHRAFWGENAIDWGKDGSAERRPMGDLPETDKWVRLEVDAAHVGIKPGTVVNGWAYTQFAGTVYWDKAGIVTQTPQGDASYRVLTDWVRDQRATDGAGLPDAVKKIVKLDRDQRNADQQKQLRDYFIENAYAESRDTFVPLKKKRADLESQLAALDKEIPTTLVFREKKEPKPAFLLHRGEYDQPRDQVERAVPAVLPPLPEGAPNNRLGFAQWLVDPSHPLTSRVAVNRFWQQMFGTGIVKTAEDFGSQGEPPSHPDLLDALAAEFRDGGWNVKQLMKTIVMPATYRQSSRVSSEAIERDPDNRLLARGPRFRLDAEMLRDQALAASGLLVPKMGGASVKPPQPDGLWFAVGYSGSNTVRFAADAGPEKVHRRTLYTFIKRTAPPPQLSTFDAPSREGFCVRRERTNTPLQALLLLNDPQYFEAARALAERAIQHGGETAESRVAYMVRLCTGQKADDDEIRELVQLFEDHRAVFQQDEEAAKRVVGSAREKQENADASQVAAWTMVANLVLNLDETLCKN
ncbi:MAG: PSD1 and planctomycete cytochrome C domain-containing protein [Pirellulaceae bacterium]